MGDFRYAQARLQARYGLRPDERTWLELGAVHTLRAYLETARTTGLAPWVTTLSAGSDAQEVEQAVLLGLRHALDEVAEWVPVPWSAAVGWVRWLPMLPILACLMEEKAAPPWLGSRLASEAATSDPLDALRTAGAGPLLDAYAQGSPLLMAWTTLWHDLWPDPSPALAELERRLSAHLARFPELAADAAWSARQALTLDLARAFRRHAAGPVAVFAYLGLLALDLERLRADLLRRALFVGAED